MGDPFVAYQKAIFTALDAGLSIPVYDFVPEDATYPYLELSRQLALPSDVLSSNKDEMNTYLTIWSDYKGQKEVLEIMEQVYALMHQQQFAMDTGRMVKCFVSSRDTVRDVDNLTFTGNVKLTTLVEH